jgi:MFS family permease
MLGMPFTTWLSTAPHITGLYLTNLLVSFHYFFVIYVNSSFVAQFIAEQQVGYLYLIGSVISVLIFAYFVRILRRVGNVRLIAYLIVLEAVSLLGLMLARDVAWVVGFFLLHIAVSPVIYLNMDLFLEKIIRNEQITGSARGLFLTMINIAQVISPLLVGFLVGVDEYWKAYGVSILFLLSALAVILIRLRSFKDADYDHHSFPDLVRHLVGNRVFYHVFSAQFLLRFFFAWMVIYTPLYLHTHIGLPWSEIGIIFTIMLLPFLLLELPLGRVADLFLGEKELLITGFTILAVTVALMPLLTIPSVALWAALLFATRVGASFLEMGTESYFFKHVNGQHAETISLFRLARPAAYVLAALVASLTLLVVPMQWSFLVLAVVMAYGLRHASALTDTK